MSASADFVTLRGGLIVPIAAIDLLLDLERRGCELIADGPDGLLIGPKNRITDEDRTGVKLWRRHLRALVDYSATAVVQ